MKKLLYATFYFMGVFLIAGAEYFVFRMNFFNVCLSIAIIAAYLYLGIKAIFEDE